MRETYSATSTFALPQKDRRAGWKCRMRLLHERSGVTQEFKYFAREVRSIVATGKLLDYRLQLIEERGETYLHACRWILQVENNRGTDDPPLDLRRRTPR